MAGGGNDPRKEHRRRGFPGAQVALALLLAAALVARLGWEGRFEDGQAPVAAAGAPSPLGDTPISRAVPSPQRPPRPAYVPGQAIVKFSPRLEAAAQGAALEFAGVALVENLLLPGYAVVSFPVDFDVPAQARRLASLPGIELAEPNYYAYADSPVASPLALTPNDPYYPYQWHFPQIQAPQAWDFSCGSGVKVAVVDTGVAYENYGPYYKAPDLASTSFVAGWDFVNGDSHPNDDNGHGTHVAGTIAQSTNNGLGVAGVAYCASVMPVKVLDGTGSGSYSNIANGITWAADNGAQVINLSLGGTSSSATLDSAVAYARNTKGALVVAAAGNFADSGNPTMYPCASPGAFCVGANRFDGTRSDYSEYGSFVDISAPGGDSTVDQNGDGYGDGVLQQTFWWVSPFCYNQSGDFAYCFLQGTSMAAPHVSGVAALALSVNPNLPVSALEQVLQATADDQGAPGWDQYYGYGRVNARAAVQLALGLTANALYLPQVTKQ